MSSLWAPHYNGYTWTVERRQTIAGPKGKAIRYRSAESAKRAAAAANATPCPAVRLREIQAELTAMQAGAHVEHLYQAAGYVGMAAMLIERERKP